MIALELQMTSHYTGTTLVTYMGVINSMLMHTFLPLHEQKEESYQFNAGKGLW